MDSSATKSQFQIMQRLNIEGESYDFIGFDVDHTLIRYNLKELVKICSTAILETLVERTGYDQKIQQFDEKELGIGLNYLIIDIQKGNLVQLDCNKVVRIAYHGFKKLTEEELELVYGKSKQLQNYSPHYNTRNDESIFTSCSWFETAIAFTFAKIIDVKYQCGTKLQQKDFIKINDDIFQSLQWNYRHYDDENYFPIHEYGHFFQSVAASIDKLVYKQEKMRQYLLDLKKQNKKLFIVTNSHLQFIQLTLSHAYGNDWKDLFDFVFVKAVKPNFFYNPSQALYQINKTQKNLKGKKIFQLNEETKVFKDGNYTYLEAYREQHNYKGKVLYFGDNIMTDGFPVKYMKNWDIVCLIQEFGFDSQSDQFSKEETYMTTNYEQFWGSFFEQPDGTPTYWWDFLNKNIKNFIRTVDSEIIDGYKKI